MALCKDCGAKVDECSCTTRSRSRERTDRVNSSGVEALLKKLAEDFTKTTGDMNNEIVAKVEDIQKEVVAVKKEVKEIDKKVEDHGKMIKALESGSSGSGSDSGDR